MSIKSPKLLDKGNYAYWNIHMSTFIKSLGMEVWQSVVSRWTIPTNFGNRETIIKPALEWNYEKRKAFSRNFIILHTILHAVQCGMDDKKFKLVASSKSAKEA